MHQPNQFDLLRQRRFAPFFWTQFLGAANDNVYKNALIIFVAFHAARLTTLDPNALVNLAGAVFIAPFVLDHDRPSRILAGGLSLWRTDDATTGNTPTRGPNWWRGPAA